MIQNIILSADEFRETFDSIPSKYAYVDFVYSHFDAWYPDTYVYKVFLMNLNNRSFYITECPQEQIELIINDILPVKNSFFTRNIKMLQHVYKHSNYIDLELCNYLTDGSVPNVELKYPHTYWFYNKILNPYNIAQFISLPHIVDYCVSNVPDRSDFNLKTYNFYKTGIEAFTEIERNGICIDEFLLHEHFPNSGIVVMDNQIYSNYNFYTSTGRPSNTRDGINLAALNKMSGVRRMIRSKHTNGWLVEIDFSGYHPQLIAKLSGYEFRQSPYIQIASEIYDSPSPEQIKQTKLLTFQQIYGGITPQYREVPFFKSILEYVQTVELQSPFSDRQIKRCESRTKDFNYFIQMIETEYNMLILQAINQIVSKSDTKCVLSIYDAFLFDVQPGEEYIIKEITAYLKSLGLYFKVSTGLNYNSMKKTDIY